MATEPAEPTPSGVKLKGKLNPGGLPTTSYFEYSSRTCDESPNCIKRTATTGPLTGNTQQEVQPAEVTGLTPGTEYSTRLAESNKNGTVDSPEVTFTAGVSPTSPPSEPKSETTTSLVTPLI
jgi:hypothetical protein